MKAPVLGAFHRKAQGAAAEGVDALFSSVAGLTNHPKLGRRVPEVDRATIREVVNGGYRVISRVDPRQIVVLTVRHGRREWDPGELRAEE